MCGNMPTTSTIATSGPRFLKSVLDNIVNWDFVAQNLDGKGLDRADQQQKAKADA